MEDVTVGVRKVLAVVINSHPKTKEDLEKQHGKVWTTEELREQFDVVGFGMPLVVVKRKSDGQLGSLFFQSDPRFYFGWQEDYSHN